MREYHFTGKVTLTGVDFYITADTIQEARRAARRGDFDRSNDGKAWWDGYEIDDISGQENE
jgi:hypothetical protein